MPNTVPPPPLDVLIISERPDHLRPLIHVLGESPVRITACFTIRQAQEIFSRQSVNLVFCDEHLSDGSYRELLLAPRFRQRADSFVLLLHTGEWEEYLDAMRLGVLDVLRCPLQPAEVETMMLRALAQREEVQREAAQPHLLSDESLGRAAAAGNSPGLSGEIAPSASPSTPKNSQSHPKVLRRGAA